MSYDCPNERVERPRGRGGRGRGGFRGNRDGGD